PHNGEVAPCSGGGVRKARKSAAPGSAQRRVARRGAVAHTLTTDSAYQHADRATSDYRHDEVRRPPRSWERQSPQRRRSSLHVNPTRTSWPSRRKASSHVTIELQSVAIGVAHMELASTPRCVGYIGSVWQWPELIRQTVDVVHGETQSRSIACDPDEVMPLQRENSVVAADNNEHQRVRVIAELLHEPEMCVETRRSCHVADVQYRLDPPDPRRHGVTVTQTARNGPRGCLVPGFASKTASTADTGLCAPRVWVVGAGRWVNGALRAGRRASHLRVSLSLETPRGAEGRERHPPRPTPDTNAPRQPEATPPHTSRRTRAALTSKGGSAGGSAPHRCEQQRARTDGGDAATEHVADRQGRAGERQRARDGRGRRRTAFRWCTGRRLAARYGRRDVAGRRGWRWRWKRRRSRGRGRGRRGGGRLAGRRLAERDR